MVEHLTYEQRRQQARDTWGRPVDLAPWEVLALLDGRLQVLYRPESYNRLHGITRTYDPGQHLWGREATQPYSRDPLTMQYAADISPVSGKRAPQILTCNRCSHVSQREDNRPPMRCPGCGNVDDAAWRVKAGCDSAGRALWPYSAEVKALPSPSMPKWATRFLLKVDACTMMTLHDVDPAATGIVLTATEERPLLDRMDNYLAMFVGLWDARYPGTADSPLSWKNNPTVCQVKFHRVELP